MHHARGVECQTRIAILIEQDETACAFSTRGEKLHRGLGRASGRGICRAEKIGGSFCHDDFHDGLSETSRRDPAGIGICITAATNQRRIAQAARQFTAGAAGRGGSEEPAIGIEGHRTDGSLVMAPVMARSVRIPAAAEPCFLFSGRNQFMRVA